MIFPLADQTSVWKTPSIAANQRLFKLLTCRTKRGLKRANVQKNEESHRIAKDKLAV